MTFVGLLVVGLALLEAPPVASRVDLGLVSLVQQAGEVDPARRVEARRALMSLEVADLRPLADAVRHAGPISPGQELLLREAVDHVVASELFRPRGGPGFLGVRLAQAMLDEQGFATEDDPGAIVESRMIGFVANVELLDGDVIVGVAEFPDQPVRNGFDLRVLIGELTAGQRVTLLVHRGGRIESVPLRLSQRPDNDLQLEHQLSLKLQESAQIFEVLFGPAIEAGRRS